MNDWLSLAIYLVGVVAMALVIRFMSPLERLDRSAACVACLLWPGALAVGLIGLVGIGFAAIFWPDPEPKRD